jgi:hypothetical protein
VKIANPTNKSHQSSNIIHPDLSLPSGKDITSSPRQNVRHLAAAREPIADLLVRFAYRVFGQLLSGRPNLPAFGLLALKVLRDGLADLRLEV